MEYMFVAQSELDIISLIAVLFGVKGVPTFSLQKGLKGKQQSSQ